MTGENGFIGKFRSLNNKLNGGADLLRRLLLILPVFLLVVVVELEKLGKAVSTRRSSLSDHLPRSGWKP